MLVLLASVAGSVDVMSYYKLGHVFTANMTGNTILLGLSIGRGNVASSLHSLAALGGFFAGALAGAFIIDRKGNTWSYYVTISIAIETLIISILAIIWLREPEVLNTQVLYFSIVLSAIAMGIQSATIWHLKIPGVVTTFLTGTITTIGMSLVDGFKKSFGKKTNMPEFPELPLPKTLEQRIELQVVVFLAYGGTAVLTGWLEYHGSRLLPVFPLALIVMVLLIVTSRSAHQTVLPQLLCGKADGRSTKKSR